MESLEKGEREEELTHDQKLEKLSKMRQTNSSLEEKTQQITTDHHRLLIGSLDLQGVKRNLKKIVIVPKEPKPDDSLMGKVKESMEFRESRMHSDTTNDTTTESWESESDDNAFDDENQNKVDNETTTDSTSENEPNTNDFGEESQNEVVSGNDDGETTEAS